METSITCGDLGHAVHEIGNVQSCALQQVRVGTPHGAPVGQDEWELQLDGGRQPVDGVGVVGVEACLAAGGDRLGAFVAAVRATVQQGLTLVHFISAQFERFVWDRGFA